jgi:hypothetical protein
MPKTSLPRCLTGGVHTPGSQWAAECPLRPGGAVAQRLSASLAAAAARRDRAGSQAPATAAPQLLDAAPDHLPGS